MHRDRVVVTVRLSDGDWALVKRAAASKRCLIIAARVIAVSCGSVV